MTSKRKSSPKVLCAKICLNVLFPIVLSGLNPCKHKIPVCPLFTILVYSLDKTELTSNIVTMTTAMISQNHCSYNYQKQMFKTNIYFLNSLKSANY